MNNGTASETARSSQCFRQRRPEMNLTITRYAPALLLVALASCGASNQSNNQANGGGTVENATLAKLNLTSDAFQSGQPIPTQYTCDGADQTPVLHWGEPPQGTRSFALVIDDPDAPSGTFRHWGVYDIPASARSIGGSQRVGQRSDERLRQARLWRPLPAQGPRPAPLPFQAVRARRGPAGRRRRTRKSPMWKMRRRSTRSPKAS